jgi:hypothetical protein
MSYRIQSVVFPKSFTQAGAIDWLYENGFKVKKLDEQPHTYRFRQYTPSYLKRMGLDVYRTKQLPNGVNLIIAYAE